MMSRAASAKTRAQMARVGRANLAHGHADSRRGGLRTPASGTYRSWGQMKARCLNDGHHAYAEYGGRGIAICDEWINSFETFLADMGERPEGTTIDRIDPDGDYEPANCRWATPKEQANNRRKPALV